MEENNYTLSVSKTNYDEVCTPSIMCVGDGYTYTNVTSTFVFKIDSIAFGKYICSGAEIEFDSITLDTFELTTEDLEQAVPTPIDKVNGILSSIKSIISLAPHDDDAEGNCNRMLS